MVQGHIVRRHIKWNTWRRNLREYLPHLVDHIKRRVCDFCLIFVPFGHDDEPEILSYAIPLFCYIGADVRHGFL